MRVLERVDRGGAYADLALDAALRASRLAPGDRALATELVYGTLRWRGRLDYLLGFVLEREFTKLEPRVATILRLGAYQLAFHQRLPRAAMVDQMVRCARAANAERATGLVNAALRRLARECDDIALPELAVDPMGHLTHALSLPSWLAERWLAAYGPDEAAALARACNGVPPLTARVHPGRITRSALLEELSDRLPEAAACRYAPLGISLGHRGTRPTTRPSSRVA
jgi:16S rRNA (cytosine967-C5)-methyltransferase